MTAPFETLRAGLDLLADRYRNYDYTAAFRDHAKGYEFRMQRLAEVDAARSWIVKQTKGST